MEGGDWDAEDLRRMLLQVAGEAAGLLRDHACEEEYSARVAGDTIKADVESEDYIADALRAQGFRGVVVGEERGRRVLGGEGLVVLVDPLDGSKNYENCIPWANVSLAVAPAGARLRGVIAGVVYPIFHGYPASFARGKGCYLGGSRLTGPKRPPAKFMYVYVENPEAVEILKAAHEILGRPKVRSLGSAALELAYTALGRGMLFLDVRGKLRNIDVAAGLGLTLECGGEVLGAGGRPLDSGVDGVERVGTVIASPDPAIAGRIAGLTGHGGEAG